MCIRVQFNQGVRIRAIAITSANVDQAPRSIKLVVNRPSIGFEDVEDLDDKSAAQVLELTEEQVKNGEKVQLRFVKFQSVNSLHVRPILRLS